MAEFTSSTVTRTLPVDAPLLDALDATAEAGWSYDKLRSSYTGACIRAHDAADKSGSSQDIGFDASGLLDTTALESFAGSGDAWMEPYDQVSGSLVTTASPPKIVSSGSTLTDDRGDPAPSFSGSDNFVLGTTPSGGEYAYTIGADGVPADSGAQMANNGSDHAIRELNGNLVWRWDDSSGFPKIDSDPTTRHDLILNFLNLTDHLDIWAEGVHQQEGIDLRDGPFSPLKVGNSTDNSNSWSQVSYAIVFQEALSRQDLRAIALNRRMI